jgi:hypothetical protein
MLIESRTETQNHEAKKSSAASQSEFRAEKRSAFRHCLADTLRPRYDICAGSLTRTNRLAA